MWGVPALFGFLVPDESPVESDVLLGEPSAFLNFGDGAKFLKMTGNFRADEYLLMRPLPKKRTS